jgi:FMN phosphatase YigB (HAD superfamily)
MNRPLIISDCDEVLLHMIAPFRQWLDDVHHIHFDFGTNFEEAFRHKDSRDPVARDLVWGLLGEFFDTEMHRQYPIDGACAALARLSARADIVVLTNLQDHRQQARLEQLASHGIHLPVYCNQGGKGPAVARLLAERAPSVTVFVDDLEHNHASVASHAPQVWRLHMVGEPQLAPNIPAAPDAHCRIDTWAEAEQWVADRIAEAA